MQKKLDRFLQFHDQRTAGIPGIFPMYRDMKARVTEKLAKGARITILGAGFQNSPELACLVGRERFRADYRNATAIECSVPPSSPGRIALEVSNNGRDFTSTGTMLTILEPFDTILKPF